MDTREMMQLCTCLAVTLMAVAAQAETAAGYLKRQQPPVFREGHTLPPLTRYGWTLPFEARVELARRWGYALEFGGYVTEKSVEKLQDPDSIESRVVKLAAEDPDTYKLAVICSRRLPFEEAPPEAWARDAGGKLLNAKAESLDGTEWQKGLKTVWSPAGPDVVWQLAGQYRAEPIAAVRAKCPISIVLNGGEYGLGVLGFARKVWEKDPRIIADKGDRSWFDYISQKKARAETTIAEAVKTVVPGHDLYIYYPTSGNTHRNRWGGWVNWCYDYKCMKPVSTLASTEHYYRHFNTGWAGKQDILTQALNAKGYEIAQGQPLCYDWLCAGWGEKKGGLDRYAGFLKCLYTAGMVGGNAGYYEYPKGGFKAEFPDDEPPHWLRQMIVFSHAHATFSHLEDYIRKGALLPGPDRHVWSKEQPAYEFPTGGKEVRVVARKRKDTTDWLIATWAAGGDAREVEVTIPELGALPLRARPAGNLYIATIRNGKPSVRPVEPDTAHGFDR